MVFLGISTSAGRRFLTEWGGPGGPQPPRFSRGGLGGREPPQQDIPSEIPSNFRRKVEIFIGRNLFDRDTNSESGSSQDKSQAHLSKMASRKVIRGYLESYPRQFSIANWCSAAIWKFMSSQSKKLSAEIYPLSSLLLCYVRGS